MRLFQRHWRFLFSIVPCALLMGAAVPGAAAQDSGLGIAWKAGPHFAGKKKVRKSISGAACAPVLPPVCIAALDEKNRTQFFTIADRTLKPGPVMAIVEDNGNGDPDTEGAAYADGFFYLLGSHGLSRKKGKFHPSSFLMFRFPVDKSTGKPAFDISADTVAPEITRSDRLRQVIRKSPGVIGDYAEKPLGKKAGGANLEGLAVIGKRMYVGFRGPSSKGRAYILSVDVDRLFGDGDLAPVIFTLELGKNIGIRDLAAVSGGLLILAGPVQEEGLYSIFRWDLKNPPQKLKDLVMPDPEVKAETLLVLGQQDDSYDVLVLYDGIKDGGPREYRLSYSR
ncbi:DUF3616 domain-containing protein [uncultured Roseibium sp.]|uniref:DUF3616 domain-containing protein n=1 Tax=uncultured Roseibium sp. TaxID=1936171 RepID=UPI0032174972